MYLAECNSPGRRTYVLRESRFDPQKNCWRSWDLLDLGGAPWEYIEYPGGNAFYINEFVTGKLAAGSVTYGLAELEELFWPFVKKEIREKLEPFHCRSRRSSRKRGKKRSGTGQALLFDKRRLCYLRSGTVDQRAVCRLPTRYFKALSNKSRDEIEQYFMGQERVLRPQEYKQYVYVAFDLQRYFRSSAARLIPQALDRDDLDRYFLKDLCRLQEDENFWAGFDRPASLHQYLVRYAVMFFDYEFDGGSAWDEYLQNMINARRFFRPPPPTEKISRAEIEEIFGVSEEELSTMDKSELTKLFRKKAHAHHPDKGGEHDSFVRLAEAYRQLLKKG